LLFDNSTLSVDGVIFYGLGNCEEKEMPDVALLESKDPGTVIKYFLSILRIDCVSNSEHKLIELVNEGLLEVSHKGNYFEVPENNKVRMSQRLMPNEIKKLSRAFEFHAVTKVYARIHDAGDRRTGTMEQPFGLMSRSVGFLTDLMFYYVTDGRTVTPTHAVRLNRNMLATLRSVMTKLQQDWLRLQDECGGCEFDKKITEGDKLRVMTLLQFMIHGLTPYHKDNKDIESVFIEFEQRNEEAIRERVQEFERQFPAKVRMIKK